MFMTQFSLNLSMIISSNSGLFQRARIQPGDASRGLECGVWCQSFPACLRQNPVTSW